MISTAWMCLEPPNKLSIAMRTRKFSGGVGRSRSVWFNSVGAHEVLDGVSMGVDQPLLRLVMVGDGGGSECFSVARRRRS